MILTLSGCFEAENNPLSKGFPELVVRSFFRFLCPILSRTHRYPGLNPSCRRLTLELKRRSPTMASAAQIDTNRLDIMVGNTRPGKHG